MKLVKSPSTISYYNPMSPKEPKLLYKRPVAMFPQMIECFVSIIEYKYCPIIRLQKAFNNFFHFCMNIYHIDCCCE